MDSYSFAWEMWQLAKTASDYRIKMTGNISKQYQLTPLQVRVLLQIKMRPGEQLTTIAELLGMNPGNLSRVCKVLENLGYLDRTRSEIDNRALELYPSEQGDKLAEEFLQHMDAVFTGFLKKYTPQQLDKIISFLRDYTNFVENSSEAEKASSSKK